MASCVICLTKFSTWQRLCGFFLTIFTRLFCLSFSLKLGTSVTNVTATDADDPVYGNSAKLVYSILEGQPYFSIEPETGLWLKF